MKLALCLDGLPTGDLPAIAAEAERRGFRKILAAETTGAEPFVACAAMAAATRSILVGTGIAGVHGRSAASTAMAAASLATLSGDRFVLGLGLQSRELVEGLHGTTYGGLEETSQTIQSHRDPARRSGRLEGADVGHAPSGTAARKIHDRCTGGRRAAARAPEAPGSDSSAGEPRMA